MIPAAPTSTLFPYTTLFRSGRRIVSPGRPPPGATRRGEPGRGRHLFRPSRLTGTGVVRPYGCSAWIPRRPDATPRGDRERQGSRSPLRSEEHTSELQSRGHTV